MSKRKILEIKELLIQLLEQREISIEKIILFGSYAKNSFRKDSDIDIIIISTDFREMDIFERVKLSSGLHREFIKRIKKPVDIMYFSDKEWKESNSLIINSARRDGEVIYSYS